MSINGTAALDANFESLLPPRRDASILDIGCGVGFFLRYLQDKGYTNLRGVEIDAARALEARTRTSAPVDTVASLPEFLEKYPGAFDFIALKSVIAHFPRECTVPYLAKIHDALRPGGRLVVETFNASRFTGTYLLYNDMTHRQAFTEYSLREVLESTGLRVVAVKGERLPIAGLRALAWRTVQRGWIACLQGIYFAERGRDRNPTILTKYVIAVCERARP